jgi:hypothetical protein
MSFAQVLSGAAGDDAADAIHGPITAHHPPVPVKLVFPR